MPRLLRILSKHRRWIKDHVVDSHLQVDDVPADPLSDLQTKENLLSVWVVKDDGSNVERIIRAVGSGRDHLDNVGYMVFEGARLADAGIEIRENLGESPDEGANPWHRDLVLSGNKLVALAKAMFRHGELDMLLKQRLRELIEEGLGNGELEREKVRVHLR